MEIENPLIHDAIHWEYLEDVKGLPARHTNVVKKHEKVIKEKTFIHEHQPSNADEQTAEGLKMLAKEYDIFTDPSLPSTRQLSRFDTWDEEKNVEEWFEIFKSKPGQAHGLSPIYDKGEYIWKPVEILEYDYATKKFKVRVLSSGNIKEV